MKKLGVPYLSERDKAIFHAALTGAGIAELFTSKSKTRSLLVGLCTAWHAYATYSHVKEMCNGN